MASSPPVESPPLIEPITAIANGDTPITSAAVTSPATTAAVTSPATTAAVTSPATPAVVTSPATPAVVTSPATPAVVPSPATPAVVTSPAALAVVTSPATTAEDLAKFDPNNRPEKKQKLDSGAGTGDDHRREREEWSGSEVTILLDSFTEKYIALNRTNLRRKDWAVVANLVAEGCDKQNRKSIEQCKNKVDNLKKRYKLETQRMESDVGSVSSWIWFKKMDYLFGAAAVSEAAAATVSEAVAATVSETASDDDKSVGLSSANKLRRSTRLAPQNGLVIMGNKKSLPNVKWKRVVFKVSGTALAGNGQTIDPKVALRIADEVAIASRCGVEVAIIIGGRNFFCGDSWVSATDLDRPTAYQIGMMATVMNSILLQSALEKLGIPTRVQSAFVMPEVAEPYNRLRAMRHLDKGRVVIFGGVGAGTGNPLFTTDTAAALRATEINADAVVKGTNVDGIFDKNNIKLDRLSFRDAVFRDGTPLDSMAIQFCEDNAIPVVLFNMLEPGNVSKALTGKQVGTLIDQ